jgi:hypothetical protein
MPAGINAVVDLSHYQTPVDFSRIKAAGIVGVIHKASQRTSYPDPSYAIRMPQAINAGLLWGAYHFGTNSLQHPVITVTGKRFYDIDHREGDNTSKVRKAPDNQTAVWEIHPIMQFVVVSP